MAPMLPLTGVLVIVAVMAMAMVMAMVIDGNIDLRVGNFDDDGLSVLILLLMMRIGSTRFHLRQSGQGFDSTRCGHF